MRIVPDFFSMIETKGLIMRAFAFIFSLAFSVSISALSALPQTESDIFYSLGIPYAEPPLGELRWKPPIDKQFDESVLGKESFAPSCFCHEQNPWDTLYGDELSEDCLFLNVWTPSLTGELPVMVWIHGGGFKNGSGNVMGELLAQHGVVVVSLNYRLGLLGFFPHRELKGRDTNFGFLDQISALKWVKKHIKNFGGNPLNVTIFGNSAGAFSVDALTNHPNAKNLFNRAIAQSSPISPSRYLETQLPNEEKKGVFGSIPVTAENNLVLSLKNIGLNGDESIKRLRTVDASVLASNKRSTRPSVNNISLRTDHFDCIRNIDCGTKLDSYMTGATSYEGMNTTGIIKNNPVWFTDNSEKLTSVYAEDFKLEKNLGFKRFAGDFIFLLSSELSLMAHSKAGTKAYAYYTDAPFLKKHGKQLGTPHGWDNNGLWRDPKDPARALLQKHYHENWSRFAYGKPLIGNGNWKPWTEEEQYWQILGKEGDNVFDLLKPRLKITNFFYNRGD